MTTVLIVEDDDLSRRLLADVVRARGYEIEELDRGEGAAALVGRRPPALVLLDIRLPGIDGFATLAEIRQAPGGAELPVVAVTASLMRDDQARIQAAGFAELLEKPVQLKRVREILRRYAPRPA